MAQAEYDKLGQGLAYDDYLAVLGAYQASRRTLELVDTLIEKADQLNERRTRDDTDHRTNANAIFYASPHHR